MHLGRDSCGTTGVGFYAPSRYGVRWFGDYRGAIPGHAHAFCIDLRYWYASRSYRYTRETGTLRNRDGARVPAERERRAAYAIWRYGRSGDARRQAAVMLLVHGMMGDARPGELDPAAAGVAPLYRHIARDAARFHGPYRVAVSLPRRAVVDRAATVRVRVLSAHGAPLPYVRLNLSASGAHGAPRHLRTNAAGVARVRLTPSTTAGLRLHVRTEPLATARLTVFAPSAARARANGQRLALPSGSPVTATVSDSRVHATPRVATRASAQGTTPGATIRDTISVSGVGDSSVDVQVALYGPFTQRRGITCSGTPYWKGEVTGHGNGSLTTPAIRLDRVGYYAFRETIAARPRLTGVATPCGERQETTVVHSSPSLATVASAQLVRPGSTIRDRIRVRGLGRSPAAVEVELFGPFATRASISCVYRSLHWHGRITVGGSGEFRSPSAAVRRAGFYAYRERLVGTPLIAGSTTPCGGGTETVLAAPQIVAGGRAATGGAAATGAGARTPAKVTIPSTGIGATVEPAGIDTTHGVLGIPSNIEVAGWWRDGSTPGGAHGTVLVAGHIDSAAHGPGAFFHLVDTRPGAVVDVTTAGGRRFRYRVTSVRSYPKADLPLGVYDTAGKPRLVLVTCGGPFDAATGHYRDNVVVTARPAARPAA